MSRPDCEWIEDDEAITRSSRDSDGHAITTASTGGRQANRFAPSPHALYFGSFSDYRNVGAGRREFQFGQMEEPMRINSSNALGCWAMVFLYLVLSLNVIAKDKDPNIIVQGTVFLIDKDSSIIMVDTRTGVRRLVVYSLDTKFRYGRSDKGQESAINQVQETQFISCSGKSDDGARLVAKECVHRWQK